jgi:cellulose synthase/poly-beta-1,6-N-acetylglucosamine synthase-like glycosyltransferase
MEATRRGKVKSVTVVIPTYKRADILPFLIEALRRQSFKDFDVVFVVKHSGDDTEEILREASSHLNITVIEQTGGHIVDAYFQGVRASKGEIVALLDDDAIPADNWLHETVKILQGNNGLAVTGDSIPVFLKGGKMFVILEEPVPSVTSPYEFALFGQPLHGLEEYKNCIADSGIVYERGNNAYWRSRGFTKAFLRGPSMAVPGKVLRSLRFPNDWILGCGWEMTLGWMLWKRGVTMLYNPNVQVYHLVHGRTSSRDFMNPRTDLLWAVEAEMLFYRLYIDEPQMRLASKLKCDIMRAAFSIRFMHKNPKFYRLRLEGIFFSGILGAKWAIYKRLKVAYSLLADLSKFQSK